MTFLTFIFILKIIYITHHRIITTIKSLFSSFSNTFNSHILWIASHRRRFVVDEFPVQRSRFTVFLDSFDTFHFSLSRECECKAFVVDHRRNPNAKNIVQNRSVERDSATQWMYFFWKKKSWLWEEKASIKKNGQLKFNFPWLCCCFVAGARLN